MLPTDATGSRLSPGAEMSGFANPSYRGTASCRRDAIVVAAHRAERAHRADRDARGRIARRRDAAVSNHAGDGGFGQLPADTTTLMPARRVLDGLRGIRRDRFENQVAERQVDDVDWSVLVDDRKSIARITLSVEPWPCAEHLEPNQAPSA